MANNSSIHQHSFQVVTLLALLAPLGAAACSDAVPSNESVPTKASKEEAPHDSSPKTKGQGGELNNPDPEPPTACVGSNAFQQAYVCAGSVHEDRTITQRSIRVTPIAAAEACHASGTDLTPFADVVQGMGGSSGTTESPDPDWYAGGAGGGAGGAGNPPMGEGWCSEAPQGTAIAGVTYSANECGDSELRLPIVYQEPENWYRLRVFHGDSPCERGELIADRSGYGTGEVVELDIDPVEGGFVSLEVTADTYDYYGYHYRNGYYYGSYYDGDAVHIELQNIVSNL